MKKILLFFFLNFILTYISYGQVLCIQSFQQNDSVYAGTTNLIVNGGFENTDCISSGLATALTQSFCPNSIYYQCNIDNWNCTGGGTNTYCCFRDSTYLVQSGTHSAYFGNGFCNVCSTTMGDTSCFIYNGCVVTGIPSGYPTPLTAGFGDTVGVSLSQNVSGLIVGNTYILEFWAGGEYDNIFTKPGLFAIDIGFGKTFLRAKSTPALTGVGTRFVITFKAISTSHTIKFTNWGHFSWYNTELVIDNVSLYALPASALPCTIGIEELYNNSFTIYPNPTNSTLTINTSVNYSRIQIVNMLGQFVFTKEKSISLNVSSLPGGIYFIQLIDNKGSVIGKEKFVKE